MALKIAEEFKNKAFRAGFAAGFSVSYPVLVQDDWDEDLHPRDDDGKFAASGGGFSSSGEKKSAEKSSGGGKPFEYKKNYKLVDEYIKNGLQLWSRAVGNKDTHELAGKILDRVKQVEQLQKTMIKNQDHEGKKTYLKPDDLKFARQVVKWAKARTLGIEK